MVLLMAAYFIFTFISIRERVQVNYYEVEEGSLEKGYEYTGLILRSEKPVYSQSAGNIYYYVADGRKVANGDFVYAIDSDGELTDYLARYKSESSDTNNEAYDKIRNELIEDSRIFSNDDFSNLYNTVNTLKMNAIDYSNLSLFRNLYDQIEGIELSSYPSPESGTVCFYTDGYEDVDELSLSSELMDSASYQKLSVSGGDLVGTDTLVYKLIDTEEWQIAFILNDEDQETFKDMTRLEVSFKDKGFSCRTDFHIVYGTDGTCFGILDLSSYMVQFVSSRFVNFEIVTNNISGLKIPDKSITTKEFYIIPSEYLAMDDSQNTGFYILRTEDSGTFKDFVQTDIYSEKDGYCYIEKNEESRLQNGTAIVMEDSSESYVISAVDTLTGVYNINKGYAVFRKIEPPAGMDELESSNGYTIVAKNTPYGLSTYDHIVLDASKADEGELIYR